MLQEFSATYIQTKDFIQEKLEEKRFKEKKYWQKR